MSCPECVLAAVRWTSSWSSPVNAEGSLAERTSLIKVQLFYIPGSFPAWQERRENRKNKLICVKSLDLSQKKWEIDKWIGAAGSVIWPWTRGQQDKREGGELNGLVRGDMRGVGKKGLCWEGSSKGEGWDGWDRQAWLWWKSLFHHKSLTVSQCGTVRSHPPLSAACFHSCPGLTLLD